MIIGITLLVLCIVFLIIETFIDFDDHKYGKFLFGWIIGMFFIIGINMIVKERSIKPIDVYQGKTTLQYTVIGSVKVDSTVVWKVKNDK